MEEFGKPWAEEKISTLKHNRKVIWEAIHDLCQLEKMSEGAIYFWATFPNFLHQEHVTMEKEFQVIEWLIRKVIIIIDAYTVLKCLTNVFFRYIRIY